MRLKFFVIPFFLIVILAGIGAFASGFVGYQRHSGLFAPVWTEEGDAILALRRTTHGWAWGLGWEFLTPPANSYVTKDVFEILRIAPDGGAESILAQWSGSPLVGRTTQHYRGRIFNHLNAVIEHTDPGLRVRVGMSIPRVPNSEVWSIDAVLTPGQPFAPEWRETGIARFAAPETVLTNGEEVMSVPGPEAFDAALLIVAADGSYRIVKKTGGFDSFYPEGVPDRIISMKSRREQIERVRAFRARQAELVAMFMQEDGLNEGAAILRAYDVMEEEGYLPRTPRITATPLKDAEPDTPLFDIPQTYLDVGLFQDIAAAIAAPGMPVKTSLGTYLAYAGDDLGVRLKEFRSDGGKTFVIRVEDRLFLIEER